MNFPQLKNALLCRIITFAVIIGGFIAPIIIVVNLRFVPEIVKALISIGFVIGLLIYLIRNLAVLTVMEIGLAMLQCYNTARKRYALPDSFSVENTEKRISRFGKRCESTAISPRPEMLQYKSNAPMTVYSSGVEKVIGTYHTEYLDRSGYQLIVHSATANSKALKGKKKHRFLDKEQKKSPLNRVTVIIIFAKSVDEKLRVDLFDIVCKNGGDGMDTSVLPCVVDLEKRICTFDSMRIPYMGFQYPMKNRGIRMIRKYLFRGKLPLDSVQDMLDPIKGYEPNLSLWSFWRTTKKEMILADRQNKNRFEKMAHREIIFEEEYLYIKWEERGIWLSVELNDELKTAEIDEIDSWDHPKSNKIAKDTVEDLKKLINTHFAKLGYTTKYVSFDE